MTQWYFARDGKQNGPVSFEQLVAMARSGGLDPVKDLVWTSSMKDWVPAGRVPDLFGSAATVADPSNPYAAPVSQLNPVAQFTTGEAIDEIVPGSEPIDVMACVKRGFDLTVRHFGNILLIGIVYFAVSLGVGVVVESRDEAARERAARALRPRAAAGFWRPRKSRAARKATCSHANSRARPTVHWPRSSPPTCISGAPMPGMWPSSSV